MTPLSVLAGTALVLALAIGPATACGWAGEAASDTAPGSVVTEKSDLARLDVSTPEGMAQMARAYRLGEGVPQDDLVARRWTRRAAEAGQSGAMNDLGQMLELGIGGAKDQAEAARWYARAAEAGIPQAQHSLAIMLFDGRGVPRDAAEAERLLRRAAQAGHPTAAADLAFRIWQGEIAAREPHEGCLWSLVAGLRGTNGGPEMCRSNEIDLADDALADLAAKAAALHERLAEKGQS